MSAMAHRFPVARVVEVAVLVGGRSPEVIEASVLSQILYLVCVPI